jgi:hypothetical protein
MKTRVLAFEKQAISGAHSDEWATLKQKHKSRRFSIG